MVELNYATEGDLPEIRSLCKEALPQLERTNSGEWNSRLGEGKARTKPLMLVARTDSGRFLGFAAVEPSDLGELGNVPFWWEFDLLAVSSENRGRGVGRALVTRVLEKARSVGVTSLYGTCDPAVADFYRHLNFRVTRAGGPLESNVLMGEDHVSLNTAADMCFFLADLDAPEDVPRLYLPNGAP
jgi:predicted N-acetyltransferase YhbS